MRDTIKGAIIGALVAAGISVLLAQTTPSWTSPRTWATDDLLTAVQFNAQIRDNLLNIRGFAVCAENGTTGTSSAGTVLYGDCRWAAGADTFDIHDVVTTPATIADADLVPFSDEGTAGDPMRHTTAANFADYMQDEVLIPTEGLANDAVTQAKIADAAVGTAQLKTGTDSAMFISTTAINTTINAYSLFPWMTGGNANARISFVNIDASSGETPNIRTDPNSQCTGGSPCVFHWRYMAASDTPSLWAIILDSDRSIAFLWEGEDPVSVGDTISPFGTPEDDDGNVLSGYSHVNVGMPSLPVVEAVYAGLTATERPVALSCTGDYVTGRGWLTTFTALADLATIEMRYEPSGRQWAMRCAAEASDEAVTAFYLDNLVVSSGAWAIP